MDHPYQFTKGTLNEDWHREIAERINVDFPGAAIVVLTAKRRWAVFLCESYLDFVHDYVLSNCRICKEDLELAQSKMKEMRKLTIGSM